MDCSPPGSSVHGISQARILEWLAIFFSRGSSWPRDWTHVSCIGRQILYHWVTWEALALDYMAMTLIEFSVLCARWTWFQKQQLCMEENLDRNHKSCLSPHSILWLFCPWDFLGKNTEMGCHFLLQWIFLTQGLNPRLLLGRDILYHWATWEAVSLEWAIERWAVT